MKKFTKTIMLALTTLCMAVCLLFSGCALKYIGVYRFESLTYTAFGMEKVVSVEDAEDDEYTSDYAVLKISFDNTFTFTEEATGEKTIREGTWEEIEDGKIKLIYTKDKTEQIVSIENGKAVVSLTVEIPLIGETGTKITLSK